MYGQLLSIMATVIVGLSPVSAIFREGASRCSTRGPIARGAQEARVNPALPPDPARSLRAVGGVHYRDPATHDHRRRPPRGRRRPLGGGPRRRRGVADRGVGSTASVCGSERLERSPVTMPAPGVRRAFPSLGEGGRTVAVLPAGTHRRSPGSPRRESGGPCVGRSSPGAPGPSASSR